MRYLVIFLITFFAIMFFMIVIRRKRKRVSVSKVKSCAFFF